MRALELLAPARTADIGIAAIDCGADAVYIGGPSFGARQAAGNGVEDIARLCGYAHRFGVRVFATVNTLLREEELPLAKKMVGELVEAGVDALIVQDPAVLGMAPSVILHASTQCAIRTVEKARALEALGFGRLVLERQLSLEQIRAIAGATHAEIEFFVHGALCVCYSGQCYLSEYLTGRSANRGECAQPCRSLYDLEDSSGHILERGRQLLSLRDYNLLHRLEELAEAGVTSFKIEGRLKGESYVKNVVRAYSEALDALVAAHPEKYCRSSFGRVRGDFVPDLDKTFNRGYTELFLDGKRGKWAAEGGGEYIGKVKSLTREGFILEPSSPEIRLSNGDGFSFSGGGFRADVCEGFTVRCKKVEGLAPGTRLYRNLSAAFERKVEQARLTREIPVSVTVGISGRTISLRALTEDGRMETLTAGAPSGDDAINRERALETIRSQIGKSSGSYAFTVSSIEVDGEIPLMPASFLNGLRRTLAGQLDARPVKARPMYRGFRSDTEMPVEDLNYKPGKDLMRTKYCVRHELGLCPKQGKAKKAEPLFLRNGKERLCLSFDCAVCEMTLKGL